MELTFASLMARANDEPDAMYGLAAKSVRISPDKLTYRFTLRPEARFHDGSKMTAHDVAFSLNTLKEKGHPLIVVQLRDMVKAEALDDATVAVTLCAEARARRAALCRGPADLLQGLLRDAAVRRIDRSKSRSARARTRSAGSRSTATSNSSGSRTGGAPIFRSAAAATISIPCATNSIATATSAFEGFTGKNYLFREEFTARDLGDALRFSRDQGRPRQARDAAGRTAVGRAGLVLQHPPRQVQGPAGARGADQSRSISNGPTRP